MKVDLTRPVPHLFLNGKKNAINPNTFGYKIEVLKLEGDFHKYFDVLVPSGYHIDALQILTPDVMSTLIDFGQEYDFELIDNQLYIYQGKLLSKELFSSAEILRGFLTAVNRIEAQFSKQAKTYSDTRAGNVASGLVAAEGARFQRRQITVISSVIVFVIIFILYVVFFLI